MPFGLCLMGTAYSEPDLIYYASAIEDLQLSQPEGYPWRRTVPQWGDWRIRNLPVSAGF
jgi:amidase